MKKISDTTPFYVTLGMLKRERACPSQLRRFAQTFGRKKHVYLSLANFRRALENGLSTQWLVWRMEAIAYKNGRNIFRLCDRLYGQICELTDCCNILRADCSDAEIKRVYDALVRFTMRATAS